MAELTKRCNHCNSFKPLSKMCSSKAKGRTYYRALCNACSAKIKRDIPKKVFLLEKSATSICAFEKLLQKVPVARFLAEAA